MSEALLTVPPRHTRPWLWTMLDEGRMSWKNAQLQIRLTHRKGKTTIRSQLAYRFSSSRGKVEFLAEDGRSRLLVQLKHLLSQIHGGSITLLMKTRCQPLFDRLFARMCAQQPMVYSSCASSSSSNSVLQTTWRTGLVL